MARYIDADKEIELFRRMIEEGDYSDTDAKLVDAIIDCLNKVPTADVAELKNMKWRPHYYIFKSTGEKMREGWVCSVCGKHSHSRKEICDGCNTTMWKVEIR